MKYHFLLCVVWVLCLPVVAQTQRLSIHPDLSNTPSQALKSNIGGISSVQMNSVTCSGRKGISVTIQPSAQYSIGVVPIGGSYVASPMQILDAPTIHFAPVYGVHAWKGKVLAVGSSAPTSVVKRRANGFPDYNPDPNPDPPVPIGDISWCIILILGIMYALCKRHQAHTRK